MRKNIISILIMSILIFITLQILLSSNEVIGTIGFSFSIWKNNVFPTLFPFFVISNLLINYGFLELIAELFKPVMMKLFKTKGEAAYVLVMSMISGFPSSAKYIRELYNKKLITDKDATKILTFTHFSNPLFIIGTIAISFLNNYEVGSLILFSHYISNIIIGLLLRNYNGINQQTDKFSVKKAVNLMTKHRLTNKKTFSDIFSSAIIDSINTLLLILGTISSFLILTTIIDKIININSYYQSILNGIFEMTQGLKYISVLELPLKLKTIISTMLISFGGLSVHLQILSILNGTNIKYFPFFISRIIHSLLSGIIIYFCFDTWLNIF